MKRRKGKGKGKGKGRSKRTGRAFFGDEQAQDSEWWSEEDFAWWSKRKARKAMMAFSRVVFALTSQTKAQARIIPRMKAKERTKKGKGKEGTYPESRLSASETPIEGHGHAWESDDWSASHWPDESWTSAAGWFCTKAHTAWMEATPLNLVSHPTHVVLDLGCIRSIGPRAAIEGFKKHAWYVIRLSCSPTPRQKPARKAASFTFQQFHHVLPKLMCFTCFPGYDH